MTAIDPLSIRCPRRYCAAFAGEPCCTGSGHPCRPHKARVKLARDIAANNDPALDEWLPKIGACGICGVPGMHQRHRVVDAIADWLEADGPDVEDELAVEYGVPVEAIRSVGEWRKRWPV